MNYNRQAELRLLIAKCKVRLKKLKPHLKISDVTNVLYNKILVEKAIYKLELETLRAGFFRKLLKSVRTINPSSRRYICDYFK